MPHPPLEVIEAALEWCHQRDYDPGRDYQAVFVSKDDELNPPDEDRDLWHVFFYPEAMKKFVTDFFVWVVDPDTLEVTPH